MPAPDQITRVPSGLKGHRSFETPTKNMMGGSHAGHESLSLSTMVLQDKPYYCKCVARVYISDSSPRGSVSTFNKVKNWFVRREV